MSQGERLKEARERRFATAAEAARAFGWPVTTYSAHENGQNGLRPEVAKRYAKAFGVDWVWLLSGDAPTPATSSVSEVSIADVPVPMPADHPMDVPVLGTAAGAMLGQGAFQITTDVIDYVRRPAGLARARDAYALYVEGDSMSPRFEPGDLVFVHPHRKPLGGDYVIVQEPDSENGEPRAFIKRLVGVTPTLLKTEQFNPPAKVDFKLRPGLRWHKVMTDGDLYGV